MSISDGDCGNTSFRKFVQIASCEICTPDFRDAHCEAFRLTPSAKRIDARPVYIAAFCEAKRVVKDENKTVYTFCRLLEDILRNGISGTNEQYMNEPERSVWQWIHSLTGLYSISELTGPLQIAIDFVRKSKKVRKCAIDFSC